MSPGKVLLVVVYCAIMTCNAGCDPVETTSPVRTPTTPSVAGNTDTKSAPGNTEATRAAGNAGLAEISGDTTGNWAIEIPETQFVPYATAK